MLRGCPLPDPSPCSQVELAFSMKLRGSIKHQASGLAKGTPANGAKPLCQITPDEAWVSLASSLWLHPEDVVWALPSGHSQPERTDLHPVPVPALSCCAPL